MTSKGVLAIKSGMARRRTRGSDHRLGQNCSLRRLELKKARLLVACHHLNIECHDLGTKVGGLRMHGVDQRIPVSLWKTGIIVYVARNEHLTTHGFLF